MTDGNALPQPGGGVDPPDALRTVFTEVNAHMRNAEQKQLTATGWFFTLVGVVLSLISGDKVSLLEARLQSIVTVALLLIFGLAVLVYQRWCRVWKEHYLGVLQNIAKTWDLPAELLPAWLRTPPGRHKHGNVDNALLYLTTTLVSALLVALEIQIWMAALPRLFAGIVDVVMAAMFVAFLLWLQRMKAADA